MELQCKANKTVWHLKIHGLKRKKEQNERTSLDLAPKMKLPHSNLSLFLLISSQSLLTALSVSPNSSITIGLWPIMIKDGAV